MQHINIALLVKRDRLPERYRVIHNGSETGALELSEVVSRLIELVTPVSLVR